MAEPSAPNSLFDMINGGSPQPSSNPPENQDVLQYIRGLQGSDGDGSSLSSMANPFLRVASQPGMSGYFQYDPSQGGVVPQMQAPTREDLSNPLDYTSEQYQPRDTGGWFGLGPQRSDFPSPSTNNWRLLGRGPGWIMRNGQLINAMTPQAKQGLPAGSDPSFSDTAESGTANYPRRVSPGGALTGRNKFDASYWPGGDIMGYLRWPYQGDV